MTGWRCNHDGEEQDSALGNWCMNRWSREWTLWNMIPQFECSDLTLLFRYPCLRAFPSCETSCTLITLLICQSVQVLPFSGSIKSKRCWLLDVEHVSPLLYFGVLVRQSTECFSSNSTLTEQKDSHLILQFLKSATLSTLVVILFFGLKQLC